MLFRSLWDGRSSQISGQGRTDRKSPKHVILYAHSFGIDEFHRSTGGPFAAGVDLGDREERSWWPYGDIKALTEWLCMEQNSFQSLRFVVGSKKSKRAVKMSKLCMD